MKAQSPFVHKFQSLNRNYYIYDVWTNRVVRVNEIVYDLIDDFGVLRYPEIIRKWMKKCPLSSIKSALTEIEIAQKKGLFLDKRFKQMVVPYDDIYLGNAIASNIGYMIVNITEACNMRCKYCAFSGTYKYERPHSNRSMDEFILCKAVDYYLKHSQNSKIRGLSFYGGEPLLAFKKITAVQKILKAKDFEFRLDTNGLLLGKKEIVDFIVRHGIGMQVSLDGPAVYHDRYRVDINGKPTFSRIMSNLRYLAKIAPEYYKRNVSFAVTLSPDIDLEVLNEFFESNELVKGHTILVNFVKPFDTTFFEQFDDKVYTRRRKQYEKLEKNYIRCRVDGKEPTAFEKALFEKSLIKLHIRQLDDLCDLIGLNGCCIPGLRKIFVDTDGRFYPCERVMRAYNIGDVDRGIEIDKIMNIARGYVMESGGDCINCWAAKICEICFAAAVKNSVFDNERKKLNCARMLNAKHHELSIYATIMEENPKAFDFTKDMVFI